MPKFVILAVALILGTDLIVAGALIGGRYSIVASAQGTGAFRLDRFTGQVWVCTTLSCRTPSENSD